MTLTWYKDQGTQTLQELGLLQMNLTKSIYLVCRGCLGNSQGPRAMQAHAPSTGRPGCSCEASTALGRRGDLLAGWAIQSVASATAQQLAFQNSTPLLSFRQRDVNLACGW